MKYWASAHHFVSKAVMYMIISLLLHLLTGVSASVQRAPHSERAATDGKHLAGLGSEQAAEAAGAAAQSAGGWRPGEVAGGGAGALEEGAGGGARPEEQDGGGAYQREDGPHTGGRGRQTDTAHVLSGYSEALLQ